MQNKTKIILGIDPGTVVLGYGAIAVTGQRISLLEMNVVRIPAGFDPYEKLRHIHDAVQQLILRHVPDEFAIEAPFYGKNVQSMLKLGRAQGVAIAAAMQCRIPVTEYAPGKVKQSITGNGRAAKEQVWKILQQLLGLDQEPEAFDASDAVAVAICHHFQYRTAVPESKPARVNGWAGFVAQNPARVR